MRGYLLCLITGGLAGAAITGGYMAKYKIPMSSIKQIVRESYYLGSDGYPLEPVMDEIERRWPL